MSRVRRLVRAGAAGFSRLHSLAGNSQQTACDSILTGDHAPTDDAPAELVAVKAGNMNGVAIFDFSSPLVCGTVALGIVRVRAKPPGVRDVVAEGFRVSHHNPSERGPLWPPAGGTGVLWQRRACQRRVRE